MTIHELNENQVVRDQALSFEAEITEQIALSHAILAQIASTGATVAARGVEIAAVNNISSEEKVAVLTSASQVLNRIENTLAFGTELVQNNPRNITDRENTYRTMQRSYLQTMLQEILVQLEELERTGYANWAIIGLIIAKLNIYSVQLNNDVILPLEGLQGVDKAHSKLKAILERIQAKVVRGEQPSPEDAKEFADAVKGVKQAIQDLKDNLPKDDDGQPIYPSKEYKDLVDRLEQNLDKILKQKLDGEERSIEDVLETPEVLLGSLRKWAEQMDSDKSGPFKDWEEGKAGFNILRQEISTTTAQYSDRLSRDAELIKALNTTAQEITKATERAGQTMVRNQLQ